MFVFVWWLSGTAILINEWRHVGKLDGETVVLSAAVGVIGPFAFAFTLLRYARNLFKKKKTD